MTKDLIFVDHLLITCLSIFSSFHCPNLLSWCWFKTHVPNLSFMSFFHITIKIAIFICFVSFHFAYPRRISQTIDWKETWKFNEINPSTASLFVLSFIFAYIPSSFIHILLERKIRSSSHPSLYPFKLDRVVRIYRSISIS